MGKTVRDDCMKILGVNQGKQVGLRAQETTSRGKEKGGGTENVWYNSIRKGGGPSHVLERGPERKEKDVPKFVTCWKSGGARWEDADRQTNATLRPIKGGKIDTKKKNEAR